MDAGGRATQDAEADDCMDAGGRATQDAEAENKVRSEIIKTRQGSIHSHEQLFLHKATYPAFGFQSIGIHYS